MKTIEEIVKEFPEKYRTPIYEIVQVLKEEFLHHEIRGIREDLNRLEKVVMELVEIQKRNEARFSRLEKGIEELTEAQKRTEQRVNDLAEAQKRTEQRVNELAEAQKRTDERVSRLEKVVEELADAQKRTEQRVNELAEAQKRTEEAVRNLAVQVGKLSDTIGYGLEDVAFVMLPPYLEKHFNIKINDPEKRFFMIGDKEIEVNLYAEGKKNGEEIVLIGECKSRIYMDDVKKFLEKYKVLEESLKEKNIIKVIFGYLIHPSAQKIAKKENVILVASYMR